MLSNGDDDENDKNDKNEENKTNDKRWSNENPKDFENDVEHIFGDKNLKKHKLEEFLNKHNGNKVEAMKEIEKGAVKYVNKNGITPEFIGKGAPISINGTTVYVRGRIVNGIVRIGTAFIL